MKKHSKDSGKAKLLAPNQVAKMLHVAPVTIRHWSLDGKLKHVTTPGGHRRYKEEDVEAFRAEFEGDQKLMPSVLIVDDEEHHGDFLEDFFDDLSPHIETVVAQDGFKAAYALHRVKPTLIMLDLMMPGMDGFAVCAHIKSDEKTRDIPVIAMTGLPSKENVSRILEAGAEICLSKPIDPDELRTLVRRYIDIDALEKQAKI